MVLTQNRYTAAAASTQWPKLLTMETASELVHAAPWLEHIQYPVKLRLVGTGTTGAQSATILCSSETLCVHSEFFRTLLKDCESKGEEDGIEVVIGACSVTTATSLLQHLHSVAALKFDGTPWNAGWADLASHWLLLELVQFYKTLIKSVVEGHFATLRAAENDTSCLINIYASSKSTGDFTMTKASQTKVLATLRQVANEGKVPTALQLVEMIGFASPFSSYPLYRLDMTTFCASAYTGPMPFGRKY